MASGGYTNLHAMLALQNVEETLLALGVKRFAASAVADNFGVASSTLGVLKGLITSSEEDAEATVQHIARTDFDDPGAIERFFAKEGGARLVRTLEGMGVDSTIAEHIARRLRANGRRPNVVHITPESDSDSD